MLTYDLTIDEKFVSRNQIRVESSLENLFEKSDIVSLHINLTSDSFHIVSKDKLTKHAKKGLILINTARGSIVDEDALYSEVRSGRLKAAFDVFWQEPYNGKLKEFHPDKFYMSPHIAGYTDSFLLGSRKALDDLISELSND